MSFFSYNFGKPFSDFALKIHFQQISFARLDEKQINFPFLNSSFYTKFLRLFIKFGGFKTLMQQLVFLLMIKSTNLVLNFDI